MTDNNNRVHNMAYDVTEKCASSFSTTLYGQEIRFDEAQKWPLENITLRRDLQIENAKNASRYAVASGAISCGFGVVQACSDTFLANEFYAAPLAVTFAAIGFYKLRQFVRTCRLAKKLDQVAAVKNPEAASFKSNLRMMEKRGYLARRNAASQPKFL